MKDFREDSGAFGRIPFKVGLVYACVGALWIFFSDVILAFFVKEPSALTRIEIFKGWFFVGVTTLLLFVLVRRYVRAMERSGMALKQSEEQLRLLVESVTDYEIFLLDPNGNITSWNIGAQRSKGYSAEEVIGSPHRIFFTEEDRERRMPEKELKTAADEGRFEDEGWRVRKDGSRYWANVVTTALRDRDGRLRGFAKVIRDISERKHAEEVLRESEERYRVIAETASDAIITIDEESTVVFANPAVKKIFGYPPQEVLGRPLTELMPGRLRERHLAAVRSLLSTRRRKIRWSAIELPGLHRDGHEVPLEISYGTFQKDGKTFFSGIVRDITERKQAEREKEYKDMLERFNQDLEILVSERTMSLMALRLADSIIDEAERLEVTVKDFHSLLKSRKSVFSYMDINEIVESALSLIAKEAAFRRLKVVRNLSSQPLRVNAQKDLLRMAVFNLLRNAVDATPEGGRVTVSTSGDERNVTVSVSDTGPGIPKEMLSHIFEASYDSGKYRYGMGLPLVKQIVSEHLGEIWVDSEEGKGVTFVITLPVRWMGKTELNIPFVTV
jgi:two-component system sensor kinase FixL